MRNISNQKNQEEKNRFDLEQEIQTAWSTCEDLNLFIKMQSEQAMSEDEMETALMGISYLHNLRMRQVWDTMELLIKKGHFL